MNIDLRKAIIKNVKDNSVDELEATIVDAIENGEEKLLPGLGVLFELIWNEADENKRADLVLTLEKGLQRSH